MTRTTETLAHWRIHAFGTLRGTLRWAWHGIVDIGHNSLAVLGLACIGLVLFFSSDSALRQQLERHAQNWLNLRHGMPSLSVDESQDILAGVKDPDAVDRATARHLKGLPRNQALVANWLAKRYRVAPEAVARLVQEAWIVGEKAKVEPTLILAIMAIESSFNPFAQSNVGAQGLMQVMTSVHDEKYAAFGGTLAAFDPLTNLRVGVQVLKQCLTKTGGDVELALKYYVGAANLPNDGGYADKVLGEQAALLQVAGGANIQVTAVTVRQPSPGLVVAAASEPVNKPGSMNTPAAASVVQRVTSVESQTKGQSNQPSHVTPAAHAAAGTVMAPAIGAALAANLSPTPPSAAPTSSSENKRPLPQESSAAVPNAPASKTEVKLPSAAQAASAPQLSKAPSVGGPDTVLPSGKTVMLAGDVR
jgi:Transglycosylase SLT domain